MEGSHLLSVAGSPGEAPGSPFYRQKCWRRGMGSQTAWDREILPLSASTYALGLGTQSSQGAGFRVLGLHINFTSSPVSQERGCRHGGRGSPEMSDPAVRGRGWSQKLQRDGKAEGTVSPVFPHHPVFSPACPHHQAST